MNSILQKRINLPVNFINYITLVLSFLGTFIALIAWIYGSKNSSTCYNQSLFMYDNACEVIFFIFGIFAPVFIISLITLKSKSNLLKSWNIFTFIYLLVYLFLVIKIPSDTHGLDFLPIVKGTVFIFLVPLYIFLSLIILGFQYFKFKNPKIGIKIELQ